MKFNSEKIEVAVLTGLGPYQEDWARVYLEKNDTYSAGGGRLTVNIADEHVGSYFFSHGNNDNFKAFVGNCNASYLIGKLFKTDYTVDMESGEEIIQFVFNHDELKAQIKEQRATGELTKKQLRDLYDNFAACECGGPGRVSEDMIQAEFDVACKVLGYDWWWDGMFAKPNPIYERQKYVMEAVIKACAEVSEVDAQP